MEILFSFIFCVISLAGFAQMHATIPSEATALFNQAMRSIQPGIKSMIVKKAETLKNRNVNSDSLIHELKKDPLLHGIPENNITAVAIFVMIQVSKNTDEELKGLVTKIGKSHNQENGHEIEALLEYKSRVAQGITGLTKSISPFTENAISSLR